MIKIDQLQDTVDTKYDFQKMCIICYEENCQMMVANFNSNGKVCHATCIECYKMHVQTSIPTQLKARMDFLKLFDIHQFLSGQSHLKTEFFYPVLVITVSRPVLSSGTPTLFSSLQSPYTKVIKNRRPKIPSFINSKEKYAPLLHVAPCLTVKLGTFSVL